VVEMKKSMIKLMIFAIGTVCLFSPQNVSDIKSRAREIMNSPFIQLQNEVNNLMRM